MDSIASLFIIYFIYGLAFFSMGLVMLLESYRADPGTPQVGLMRPLAFFGLLHGIHEWLEVFLIQIDQSIFESVNQLKWIRLVLLATSFVSLWLYSIAAFRFARDHITVLTIFGLITLPIFALIVLSNVVASYLAGDILLYQLVGSLVRYGLGVTGAAVATLGLQAAALKATADDRKPLDTHLKLTSFGFGIYSITQLFVPAMDTILASWLNATAFQIITGIPIQVIRAIAGIIMTIGLVNVTRYLEYERRSYLVELNYARLKAMEDREAMSHDLLRQVVRAQEDERARISRELHDEMAQTLTALTLDIGSLLQLAGKRSKLTPILERLRSLGDDMSHDMSRMVRDLRPALLDDLGLVSALRYLAENEGKRLKLRVAFDVVGLPKRFGSFSETVLFRVTQEALTNIARHAQTDVARMRLEFSHDNVTLKIADEGIGFDLTEKFIPPQGFGLAGMRERIAATGGEIEITSNIGKGTTITAKIPLPLSEGDPDGKDHNITRG